MTLLVDTHCHLDSEEYDSDRADVIARAADSGVTRIINPAVDVASGKRALALTVTYPGVYAAVGIHPNSTADIDDQALQDVEAQAKQSKVVAIGEIGLDYYREHSPKERQRIAFEQQLTLAAQLELPVIIHNREASDDVLAVLAAWVPTLPSILRDRPGVLHSFSAPRSAAERALALGFYLGFTGPITYKNADDLRSIAAAVPLDRILVETDGPYLAPQQHRGKRNEPAYVRFTAERLATLRTISDEALQEAATQNAERLFKLPTSAT